MPARESLFIYRPLMPESLEVVQDIQERLKEVPTFIPTSLLHLMLMGSGQAKRLNGRALTERDRRSIVHPLPTTAEQTTHMRVEGLDILSSTVRTIYILALDRAHQVRNTEHRLFNSRAVSLRDNDRRVLANNSITSVPHVTLGMVSYEQAVQDTLALAGKWPKVLHFASIVCDPEVPVSPSSHYPDSRAQDTVRKIQGPIPSGFLASLRSVDAPGQPPIDNLGSQQPL